VATFVMRVWLADRPGALGAVASRIGSVGGDVVGIDILERGAGRVIDELIVDLPSEDLIPLMLKKVGELDAVDVEDVRPVHSYRLQPPADALEVAARLLEERSVDGVLSVLASGAAVAFSSEWTAVVDPEGPVVLASAGSIPAAAWLDAFVSGMRSSSMAAHGASAAAASDTAWAPLDTAGLVLVTSRTGRPFRARERRQLCTLARVADYCWNVLVTVESVRSHPTHPPS
jgi:hypothetical protein